MTGGLRHAGDEDNFVVVPRPTIRDARISLRARGLLTFILDLPSGWEIKASWIATQTTEGEEAVYTALKELKTFGYYRVERRRGDGGRWVTGTAISKRPKPSWAAQYAEELAARAEKRKVELPIVEVLEDGSVVEDGVTESDAPTAPTDSAESPNRTGSAVSGNRETDQSETAKSQGGASTEEREGEGDRSSVSHLGNARPRGARTQRSATAELDPAPRRDGDPPAELGGRGHQELMAWREQRWGAKSPKPERYGETA